ncbi:MAG TPA: PIG-L family deacetylase [Polyangia bacterium]|nr:PIG-L family deacetylase [Polyangia bacterium]
MTGNRVLLLAPHPDDEVAGCAAAIGRVRARGARVFVLYLTTGIPAPQAQWSWRRGRHAARVVRRREEAQRAADRLEIEPTMFLPWPSRELKTRIAEARTIIREQSERVRADALWTPAYEGGHQDHDVASFLASGFARELAVIEFAEYNHHAGVRSHEFPTTNGDEQVLTLSAEERTRKRSLLELYRSERNNLGHVRLEREVLRPLGRYDYARRPHVGVLFYERFQWVPFRHPRIDFTRGEDVCAACVKFCETGVDCRPSYTCNGVRRP